MALPPTYEACLAFVWQFDGAKNDRAPGESFATAYGVTQATWDYATTQGLASGDIADATGEQCSAILRALYWNAAHCSSLPSGVSLMVFNDAVLTGTGHAVRLLQRIVGAVVDGVVGPETVRRAGSFGGRALIDALAAADDEYEAALANAALYLNGWRRREGACQQLAYQMAGITPAPIANAAEPAAITNQGTTA